MAQIWHGSADGKFLAIALLLVAAVLINPSQLGLRTFAADPTLKGNDIVNPINTVWTLVAAFLVFGMQVGFTMLEAGFCRSRETVNVLMECIVDTCLCGILFYAFGFAFMFSHGNGFIGYQLVLPARRAGDLRNHRRRVPGLLALPVRLRRHLLHDHLRRHDRPHRLRRRPALQRRRLRLHLSDHRPLGLGSGRLPGHHGQRRQLPALGRHQLPRLRRFDGRPHHRRLHRLAGAIVLGPRLGRKFKRDGGGPMLPHDLTIAASGGLLLWFGWYGFNPGSTLSAMDFDGIGRVAANTTLAACAAGLTAMLAAYMLSKKWDVSFTVNGFLAGLVAITCPCYWVSPTGAILLGGIAGVIVVVGVELLE